MNSQELKVEFRQVKELEDHYKLQFKVKFGKDPGTTIADRHQLSELLKTRSDTEVKMLIDHYLKMTDLFFKKSGYSLEIFFRKFNQVVMDVDKVKKARAPSQLKMISTMGYCRNKQCMNRFPVMVTLDFQGLDNQWCGECE